MDSQQLLEKYSPFLTRNLLPICLGLFGLIFLGYGLIALIGGASRSSSDIIFESSQDTNLSSASNSGKVGVHDIVVDVEGAVLRPGVHHVSSDSRVQEALIKAGGLSESADRNWVTKNLNLAVKLTDGAKIYIPKVGEDTKSITGGTGTTGITGSVGGVVSSEININTASPQELDSLPGVGLVTTQKIISGRPYGSIDELLSRKIVSSKVFEQIKEKIEVY